METVKSFESTGYILKVETLTTVSYNVLKKSLVLESLDPFPGYHGKNLPSSNKPRILYFVTRKRQSFDDVALLSKDIRRKFVHPFTGNPAEIRIHQRMYHAIRIKFLESFEFIPELQSYYREAGIRFRKYCWINAPASIKVYRYYCVNEVEEGIYRDLLEPEQCYVELPVRIEWNAFEELTLKVKDNLDNRNFDAAQGVMFRSSGPVDLVRIWDRDKTLERTRSIRMKYLELMKLIQLI